MTVKINNKDLYDEYLNAKKYMITSNVVIFAHDFLHYADEVSYSIDEIKTVVNAIFDGEEVKLEEQKYEVIIAPEIPTRLAIMNRYLVKDKNGTIFQDCKPFDRGYNGQLTWSEIPEEYQKWAKKVED